MITSAKNYTKKKRKKNRQDPRTDGKRKAIQTDTKKHIHTHSQKEKKEKNIYI